MSRATAGRATAGRGRAWRRGASRVMREESGGHTRVRADVRSRVFATTTLMNSAARLCAAVALRPDRPSRRREFPGSAKSDPKIP